VHRSIRDAQLASVLASSSLILDVRFRRSVYHEDPRTNILKRSINSGHPRFDSFFHRSPPRHSASGFNNAHSFQRTIHHGDLRDLSYLSIGYLINIQPSRSACFAKINNIRTKFNNVQSASPRRLLTVTYREDLLATYLSCLRPNIQLTSNPHGPSFLPARAP